MKEAGRKIEGVEEITRSGTRLDDVVISCVQRAGKSLALFSNDKEIMDGSVVAEFKYAMKILERGTENQLGEAASGILLPGLKFPLLELFRYA
ncbi:MAG: hypothetical protein OXD44_08120 [Gammaproteobacteria bacterium]|nr:hypothetical protein [Gammaproteobacteria bacterium]MCY4313642.1 hypothetical protein [Gammaproteobacteria bacterium]